IFLKGQHNVQNIITAFVNCFLSKINPLEIVTHINSFKGLRHRLQLVGSIGEINFVNDSKATNAESTKNALESYDDIYLILGGKAKEGGIDSLKKYFPKIKYAFLIGEASEQFAATFGNQVEYFKCENLKNAFETAYTKAKDHSSHHQKN